mgnify:CR=1 FL=1
MAKKCLPKKFIFKLLSLGLFYKTKVGFLNLPDLHNPQKDYFIVQDFVKDILWEWRILKIGDSYFGHQKLLEGQFASGSGKVGWVAPPQHLLEMVRELCQKGGFRCMDVDIFETKDGKFVINELQASFGSYLDYQMCIDGIPGRYKDINTEKINLAREHGLPIEMTIVRLTDVPVDVVAKLTKPKSCDAAVEMAESFGGVPQKFTALQYELSSDIRERVAGLKKLTWSPVQDGTVLLVCDTKKTSEYKNLDTIIKQNAQYKQAMFLADQQLKQLRRKAVIVINDDRYKL